MRAFVPGLIGAAFFSGAAAQEVSPPASRQPFASEGGQASMIAPRPVDAASDPVNAAVAAQTVDGLALALIIDGASVALDSAAPARVPRSMVGERKLEGDVVVARAFAGGELLSTSVVADPVMNASEGGGLVRTERRQVALALGADRPIEKVEIEAAATGARATLDVTGAYARYCEADPNSKWCPRGRGD